MKPQFLCKSRPPQYHPDRLIVKLASAGAEPLRIMEAAGPAGVMAAAGSSGLAALARYQRAGIIKQAIPLSGRVRLKPHEAGPARAMATLAASLRPEAADTPNARTNLLELYPSASLEMVCADLAADPSIEFVSKVPIRYLCVPRRAGRARPTSAKAAMAAPGLASMWNLGKISWAQARELAGFTDADQIKVGVLDTGVDVDHPDLRDAIANYVYNHPNVPNASSPKDYIGHGTHVSGTIAASINNDLGINGICRCEIWSWKIFDDEPDYNSSDDYFYFYVDPAMYHRALAQCLEEGVKVINLSIGGTGEPDPNERSLFEQLDNAGVTIVAAMGNEREQNSPISYPAAIPGVIAVGATRINDQVADFSNRGAHISLAAPGDGIWSTLPTYPGQTGYRRKTGTAGNPTPGEPDKRDVEYAAWNGTSMATPHVSAAAALLLAKTPGLSPAQVRDQLMKTCDRVPGMGNKPHHPDYGAGRLNLLKLLQ
jgi:subtilisin family serine protease